MTIPFGRRRLVLSLESAPAHRALQFPALDGASDAELAHAPGLADRTLDRVRWETMLIMHGFRAY